MEIYVLKSSACLAFFFAFYKLFLENTSIHGFKRFYLLGSVISAFIIPLITFTNFVEGTSIPYGHSEEISQLPFLQTKEHVIPSGLFILYSLYGFGLLFFTIQFFRNLFYLIQQIRKNPKCHFPKVVYVLLKDAAIPFTFLNYIFLNKQQYETRQIPQVVLLHEETHTLQKHSLDLIFISLLQIVLWFNPLLYFIKRSIKLNHEFLADRAVLNVGTEISEYQKIVLAFSSYPQTPILAHSLNYSSIKKRFIVMKTRTSNRTIWLRSLLILPLLSLLIVGFSEKQTIQKGTESLNTLIENTTDSEIKEFNTLAQKYNAIAIENRIIPIKDLQLLETIYKKMTHEQRARAEAFPEGISKMAPQAYANKKERLLFVGLILPPTPNPNPVEYIKELAQKGAIFYIGPHKYSSEEAIELVRKSKMDITIDVSQYPEVRLGGC